MMRPGPLVEAAHSLLDARVPSGLAFWATQFLCDLVVRDVADDRWLVGARRITKSSRWGLPPEGILSAPVMGT